MKRRIINLGLSTIGPIALIVILTMPIGPLAGGLGIIQPIGGIFDNGSPDPGSQRIQLIGLEAQVDVIIDHMGIPHIYADSSYDAFMALGYMHAKDRLFQITMQNYVAAGRISEIVGQYAASSDKFYRTIGLKRSAQLTLDWYEANAATNPDIRTALDAIYAEVAGANAFIKSMTAANTPIEFKILGFTPEPWTFVDCFVNAKMLTWGLSGSIMDFQRQWIRTTIDNDTMYEDLFPDLMPYTIPVVQEQVNLSIAEYPLAPGGFPATENPSMYTTALASEEILPEYKLEALLASLNDIIKPFGDEELVGSNNWAINGSKSSTGMPIVAGDPHLSLQAPSVWYEAHIVVPDEGLDVTGTTFPGLPAVLIGHNDHLAYSFTNVGADVNDIFVEQLNPSNPNQYMYNGEYQDFIIHDETIHTKEGVDIAFTVKESVHGPLIDSVISTYDYEIGTHPNLAMNWTGSGVTHEMVAAAGFMRADTLEEFIDAMYWWDSPPQNCVFGDDEGNIAMLVVGRFPVRAGYTGEYPITALNDSVGMVSNIPYAYNPREINPSRGFVQSANQRTIAPSEYGYDILGPQANGYRARRIYHLLDLDDSITVEEMKRIQADVVEVRAEVIVPHVVSAWDNAEIENTTIADAVDILRSWTYDMETHHVAPTIWMYLLDAIHYETFDELRDINSAIPLSRTPILEHLIVTNNTNYFDDKSTNGIRESRDDILVRALSRALDNLAQEWIDEPDWNYGNRHIVYIEHLAGLTYIGGGSQRGQNTINVAGGWTVRHGPSTRLIADFSQIEMSYMAYPGGQSGNMFSPHWDDNFDLWYAFDSSTNHYGYHIMYFYSTVEAFNSADTDGSLIERTITFVP
ncbi:penicillin acylase family protein [Candidatus Thorarchaeota archaeon]|nr:MAG: penicillin acylase family protein [Candidatus Thorarchaeota archaeon]